MTHSPLTFPLALYSMMNGLAGLGLLLSPNLSVWHRLLGLQVGLMGFYLWVLGQEECNFPFRSLIRFRFLIPLGYIALVCLRLAPLWLLILAFNDFLWIVWLLLMMRSSVMPNDNPLTDIPKHYDVWFLSHLVVLGLIPFIEGLGSIFFPDMYGRLMLGLSVEGDKLVPILFGLHSLYLAGFWLVVNRNLCEKAVRATAWGRVVVALAFVGIPLFTRSGYRLIRFVLPLLVSALWTSWELRRRTNTDQ